MAPLYKFVWLNILSNPTPSTPPDVYMEGSVTKSNIKEFTLKVNLVLRKINMNKFQNSFPLHIFKIYKQTNKKGDSALDNK